MTRPGYLVHAEQEARDEAIRARRRWTLDDVDVVAPALGVPPAWLLLARDAATRGYRAVRRFVTAWYHTRVSLVPLAS